MNVRGYVGMAIGLLASSALASGCASAAGAQPPAARRVGGSVCVAASATVGTPPAGAASGCGGLRPGSPAWQPAVDLHVCTHCEFTYDDATTRTERATRAHATECCYHATELTIPAGGPRS